jgi:type IV secretion system protein VirB10
MWWHAPSASRSEAVQPGQVIDHRVVPPGVAPRHLQQWLLIGVAVVMAGIMAMSGSPARPRPTSEPAASTPAVDANQQRIEDFQQRIQEQVRRLSAAAPSTPDPRPAGTPPASAQAMAPAAPPARTQPEPIARVADNVAFSKPPAPLATGSPAPVTAPPAAVAVPAAPVGVPPSAANPALSTYRVPEGTVIDTVLTNRLDGTFTGPVNCLVNVPVYASDQQHVVIPAGARVLGESRAVNTFGQSRLAVVFHRVLQPNGARIDLNGFHGLNQIGDLGLADQVDRHYEQIFGVSLAIGAIAGFAQAQTSAGIDATGLDLYRQGMAANVSQSSARVLDRFLNLLPTVTIREGHRIKIYLSNELELPAYRETAPAAGGRP